MRDLLVLAVAGALGTVARYLVSGAAHRIFGERLAWGTFTVNVIGCFLIGFVVWLGLETDVISRTMRLAVSVGFLGAFTTFSTFSYETLQHVNEGDYRRAVLNAGANLVVGLAAVWAGVVLARVLAGGAA